MSAVSPILPVGHADDSMVPVMAQESISSIIGKRVVVRLVQEPLLEANSFVQKYLGLETRDSYNVGMALPRAEGFPEWPIIIDPDNAHHALNLVSDVEWARRMVATQPNKVKQRIDALVKTLLVSVPHFAPPLLEEIARIFDNAGNSKYAVQFFGKAREIDRTYGGDGDTARHRRVMEEFARRGCVSAKDMTRESVDCVAMFGNATEAYRYVLHLNSQRCRAGMPPYSSLARDLIKVGKAAEIEPADVCKDVLDSIDGARGMRAAPLGFYQGMAKHLSGTSLKRLFATCPSSVSGDDWAGAADKAGLFKLLTETEMLEWLCDAIKSSNRYSAENLVRVVEKYKEILHGHVLRVACSNLHLSLLISLEKAGVIWEFTDPVGTVNRQFWSYLRGTYDILDIGVIFRNPRICERLLYGITLSEFVREYDVDRLRELGLSPAIDYLVRCDLAAFQGGDFLLPQARNMVENMDVLAKLELSRDVLDEAINALHYDFSAMLARNLQAGLLTELSWPALEKAMADFRKRGFFKKDKPIKFFESYPGVVALIEDSLVAVEGESVVATYIHPDRDSVIRAGYVGDALYCMSAEDETVSGEWSHGQAMMVEKPENWQWGTTTSTASLLCPAGRLTGAGIITAYATKAPYPAGNVYGSTSGDLWRLRLSEYEHGNCTIYSVDPHTGQDKDESYPSQFDAVTVPSIRHEECVMLPAPAGQHVVPVHDGEFFSVFASDRDKNLPYMVITGDGNIVRSGAYAPGLVQFGGVTWLRDADGNVYLPGLPGDEGLLAETHGTRGKHWLHDLPWSAWINLQVRNEAASQRLRTITPYHAAVLLNSEMSAARFLSAKDPELCASVDHCVEEVRKLDKKLKRLRSILRMIRDNVTPHNTSNGPQVDKILEHAHKYQAGVEAEQLVRLVRQVPVEISGTWKWLLSVGNEKSLVAWASGPLANPLVGQEVAAMFSVLANAGIGAETWNQVSLNWTKLGADLPQLHTGLVLPNAVVVGKPKPYQWGEWTDSSLSYRVFAQGELPYTDTDVVGITALGAKYGIVPGLTSQHMAECALSFPEPGDIDRMVHALSDNCALTEAAATVLFNGGFHPLHQGSRFHGDDIMQQVIDAEDKPRLEAAKKSLRISAKVYDNAIIQLRELDLEHVELLLAAAFDRNYDAIARIAAELPQTVVPLDDDTLVQLTGWYSRWDEKIPRVVMQAAQKLSDEMLVDSCDYGRLLGAVLYWATHAPLNDPLRGFYADQLDILKTIEPVDNSRMTTQYPLQGSLETIPPMRPEDSADARRALRQGYFDEVIAGLRREVSSGGCPLNPALSASDVVDEVCEHLGLGKLAAMYFLQLLAIAYCPDVSIRTWNNWKKKDLDAARGELLEKQLVVHGKRTRAGRSVFLPCPWWEASSPHYPMEEWKAQYYLVRYGNKAWSLVPWCPPLLPLDTLFRHAWDRYKGGDVPRMEELTTTRYKGKSRR